MGGHVRVEVEKGGTWSQAQGHHQKLEEMRKDPPSAFMGSLALPRP